jgi:hypothetical protein
MAVAQQQMDDMTIVEQAANQVRSNEPACTGDQSALHLHTFA